MNDILDALRYNLKNSYSRWTIIRGFFIWIWKVLSEVRRRTSDTFRGDNKING